MFAQRARYAGHIQRTQYSFRYFEINLDSLKIKQVIITCCLECVVEVQKVYLQSRLYQCFLMVVVDSGLNGKNLRKITLKNIPK
jgi:hypothetical protein